MVGRRLGARRGSSPDGRPLPLRGPGRDRRDRRLAERCAAAPASPRHPQPGAAPGVLVVGAADRTRAAGTDAVQPPPRLPGPAGETCATCRCRYVGFDGDAHTGEMVVHEDHAAQVASVFERLYDARWPIRRMRLVDDYGGDDDRSMAANNTSAYNCRRVAGQPLLVGPRLRRRHRHQPAAEPRT